MFLKSALILILTVAVYWPAMHADFVYDDGHFVIGNDYVRQGQFSIKVPRVATLATYRLNFLTTGDNPFYFHLTNLLIHLLNGALVFALARALFDLGDLWALFMAGLFLLHPLQSEAVIYITGRAELLATFFILLSTLWFARSRYILAILAFFLAAGSKEIGLMAPALWWLTAEYRKRSVWPAFLAAGIGVLLSPARGYLLMIYEKVNIAECYAIFAILARAVLPIGLNIDHDFTGLPWTYGLAFLPLSLMLGIAFLYRKTLPGFAVLWIGALLVPHVLMEPEGYLTEHHFYSPMLGIALLLTLGIRYLCQLHKPVPMEVYS